MSSYGFLSPPQDQQQEDVYGDDNIDDDVYNQNVVPEVINLLTDGQVKALSLLFIFSGTLSILGSSTIVTKVLKNRSKATPYDRLMLGLSSCDIVASMSWILTPFLLPEETSPRVWAQGTDTSCMILGTISQLGNAAIFYNLILSFYYLLTVRLGVKRQVFARRYEPYMHSFGLLYFIVTATMGAVYNVYSEVDLGMGCWVNDYPKGCEVDPKTCTSPQIGWAFGAGPLLITLIALFTNNLIIYFHVKHKLGAQQLPGSSDFLKSESGLTSDQARQFPTRRELDRARQHQRHIREVATQGFLYVVTFFCAYLPSQILRAIEAYAAPPISEQPIFPLLVLNSILLPLQGFFNMFVYNRPNYTRLRMAYPELSYFWALKTACLDSTDIPRLTEASRISSSRGMMRSGGSGSGVGVGGTGSHQQRENNKFSSGSGRAFSSDLDVLPEASQEESLEDDDYEETEEHDDGDELRDGLDSTGMSTTEDDLKPHLDDEVDDDDDENSLDDGESSGREELGDPNNGSSAYDFDLSEEYKKVFQDMISAPTAPSSTTKKTSRQEQQNPPICHRISYDGSVG